MENMWIEMHRDEAIADARAMIAKSPELTKMYEKEQRARAKLKSGAPKLEPIKSASSAVQQLGAE